MTIASPYSAKVAAEVRAEMARQHKKLPELARVIGRTWHTAKSRTNGDTPFTYDELMQVCEWLGVDLDYLHRTKGADQKVCDAC
ncbi:XRE family transcriptional regulator [Nocardia amamiensis]|uniref:XRE family transcriptional regulator n=1 Tax=Nocardia amamiensis TaxID=404578 RepID=A0ABS0CQ62_9NOCA|nr:XRE family transcriptional regulator [Nocardia amamiensis]MBF6298280.1 XRE family transcriptional regulator [Nocardia amamiensis]